MLKPVPFHAEGRALMLKAAPLMLKPAPFMLKLVPFAKIRVLGQIFKRDSVEEGFVAEDAVKGGAADGELTGGAELVAAVQVKDVLDVMADDGVERKVVRADRRVVDSIGRSCSVGRARLPARMTPLSASRRAVSSTLASSRTLPGQLC